MKDAWKIFGINSEGQTALQFILPLIILLFFLIGTALMIPGLSFARTMALLAGMVIFVVSFISTEIALCVLIFSMLLSPEFVVGVTGGASMGRGSTLRMDDFLLVIIGFSWLAKMAILKDLGLFLRTPVNKSIAFYILVCLVSTLFGALFGRLGLEAGFLGIFFFFLLLSTIFKQAKYSLKSAQGPFQRGLCMGFLAGFVGLMTHALGANTFIIVRIMEPFWFVTAMVVMIPELNKTHSD